MNRAVLTGLVTDPSGDGVAGTASRAEGAGFKKSLRDNVQVSSGGTLRVDLVLEVGQVIEPAWQAQPFRGPATDLGGTTYFWQRTDSGRPPEFYTWNLDA